MGRDIVLIMILFAVITQHEDTVITVQFPNKFSEYSQNIPGSNQSIELVPVPGGTLMVGMTELSINSFWMGKYEVTWDQYDLFVKEELSNIDFGQSAILGMMVEKTDALSLPTTPYVDMSFGIWAGMDSRL